MALPTHAHLDAVKAGVLGALGGVAELLHGLRDFIDRQLLVTGHERADCVRICQNDVSNSTECNYETVRITFGVSYGCFLKSAPRAPSPLAAMAGA